MIAELERLSVAWIQMSEVLSVPHTEAEYLRASARLTRIWAGLYTRPRMGTDSIQPTSSAAADYRLPTTARPLAAQPTTQRPTARRC